MIDVEAVVDDCDADAAAAAVVPRGFGADVGGGDSPEAAVVVPLPLAGILRVGRPGARRQVLEQLGLGVFDRRVLVELRRDGERILPGRHFYLIQVAREPELAQHRDAGRRQFGRRLAADLGTKPDGDPPGANQQAILRGVVEDRLRIGRAAGVIGQGRLGDQPTSATKGVEVVGHRASELVAENLVRRGGRRSVLHGVALLVGQRLRDDPVELLDFDLLAIPIKDPCRHRRTSSSPWRYAQASTAASVVHGNIHQHV